MDSYRWNWQVFWNTVDYGGEQYYQWLVSGLLLTIATSLLAWCLALSLGILLGVCRTTPLKWVCWIGDIYVEVFRNIPLIVQMFLWFFVLPEILPPSWGNWLKTGLPLPEFYTAVFSLAFFTAARIAEQVKAGIMSIPLGQKSAGLAMGFTLLQVYRYILLPCVLRIMIPPLTSEFINIFKNSSVALTIGLLELMAKGQQVNEYTFQGMEVFSVVTLLYVGIALVINAIMAGIEERVKIPGYLEGR